MASNEIRPYVPPDDDVIQGKVIGTSERSWYRKVKSTMPPVMPAPPKKLTPYEEYFAGTWRPTEPTPPPEPVTLGFWASMFYLITGLKPRP